MAKEPDRPGFAAYGGANAFEPPLGRPLADKKKKATHGVGGGVVSKQPAVKEPAVIKADRLNPKQPDMAAQMKRMLRRK